MVESLTMCFSIIPYVARYKRNVRLQLLYKQMNLLLVNDHEFGFRLSRREQAGLRVIRHYASLTSQRGQMPHPLRRHPQLTPERTEELWKPLLHAVLQYASSKDRNPLFVRQPVDQMHDTASIPCRRVDVSVTRALTAPITRRIGHWIGTGRVAHSSRPLA